MAKKVKEIPIITEMSTEDFVGFLLNAKKTGENVTCIFRRHEFNSEKFDEEIGYIDVYKKASMWNKEQADRFGEIVERGKNIMYPEKLSDLRLIYASTAVESFGKHWNEPLDIALGIIENLRNAETFDSQIPTLEALDSKTDKLLDMVLDVVFTFSEQGPEFYEFCVSKGYEMKGDFARKASEIVDMKRENKALIDKYTLKDIVDSNDKEMEKNHI